MPLQTLGRRHRRVRHEVAERTAATGLNRLAATLIGAGFGTACVVVAASAAPEGVASESQSTVIVTAGAAPAAPTGAELVFAFRG